MIPRNLSENITTTFGAAGRDWLAALPALLELLAGRWSLTIGDPFPDAAYNFVAPATRQDGSQAVLKVSPPDGEYELQAAALRAAAGGGMVRLLEDWPEPRAMLIERAQPGIPIFELGDDVKATQIATEILPRIWVDPPDAHPFPSIADWGLGFERLRAAFEGGTGPFPRYKVERAEAIYRELLGSAHPSKLLHGDFHHWNLLSAERGWLAIDPKGLVGEPEYELCAWLRNVLPPNSSLDQLKAYTSRRIDQFGEMLGFDRQRIRQWGFAQALLSSWWSFEDHHPDWSDTLHIAELF
jgi:streptomycin 6-kinase